MKLSPLRSGTYKQIGLHSVSRHLIPWGRVLPTKTLTKLRRLTGEAPMDNHDDGTRPEEREAAIFTVRAKHQGEVLAHCYTRLAFVPHVVADERPQRLFELWRGRIGLHKLIAVVPPILDRAAARAGL